MFANTNEKYTCNNCSHNKVCAYKEEFKDVLNKVDILLNHVEWQDKFKVEARCLNYIKYVNQRS